MRDDKPNIEKLRKIYSDSFIHENAVKINKDNLNSLQKRNENSNKEVETNYFPITAAEPVKKVKTMNTNGAFSHITNGVFTESETQNYGPSFVVTPNILTGSEVSTASVGWNLIRIVQRDLPLGSSYNPVSNGTSAISQTVHVYVIDTGIDSTHAAFTYVPISLDYPNSSLANDCNGHGTHVSSTIAGQLSGVLANLPIPVGSSQNSYNIELHAIRVLGCDGTGTTFDVISGLVWVYDNAQYPAIVTMSLGSELSFNLDDAVTSLIQDKGIPVVAAAGNDASDACNVSPAGATGVYAVGSIGINDEQSSFSNWGTCVSFYAPGENILGAYFLDQSSYFYLSGTSMSTPHVTATIAAEIFLNQQPSSQTTVAFPAIGYAISNATSGEIIGNLNGAANEIIYIGDWNILNSPTSSGNPNPPPQDTAHFTSHKTNNHVSVSFLLFLLCCIYLNVKLL